MSYFLYGFLQRIVDYLRGLVVFCRQLDGVVPLVEADARGDGLRDVVALDERVHRLLPHPHRTAINEISG